MAKKLTSQDLKNKWQKGEEDLDKLRKQRDDLQEKIATQQQRNQALRAEYVTSLLTENDASIEDLEDLLLQRMTTEVLESSQEPNTSEAGGY
ncbi:TPA: hypothetical protein ACGO97_001586 [Streptococcus suis]|uniref:hypothetical protein n=1 Tax=Streptococcus suis TaxID=1307 RepID=UPI000943467E|nr:hypothetical protein [Streptococcus suis]QZS51634.1 hypothetical protein K6976_02130 [Streptococcus suis]QZS52042.1 hypothetical protein K6976_04415 [Streptococcus suis]RRR59335.1 hypothetical protein EI995_00045 [Streptococcus suis]RRR65053.1 hypothetical protein EI993_00170 [Streptococcus suis]HEM3522866.1 hypothetical protein [Streptococcus suis]